MTFHCFSCSAEVAVSDRVGRQETCLCGADLHVCKNCRFYDLNSYNECRETSAEVVRDKESSNFCDYFEPGDQKGQGSKKEDLLAAAEALFKK
ncbi:MAG: hypothetical protein KDD61_18150 [Bdellovibrionales bacterium]|nr:hypothetical protein [Bdellovibrionales bacterium]